MRNRHISNFVSILFHFGRRSIVSVREQCSVESLLIYVSKITWNGEGLKTLSCSISGNVVMLELPACLGANDLVPSYFALLITSIIIHCMYRCRYIIKNQVLWLFGRYSLPPLSILRQKDLPPAAASSTVLSLVAYGFFNSTSP